MNFKKYITDRLGYIVLYLANTALVIMVMYFTIIIKYKSYSSENIGYAFLVAAALLAMFIAIDYAYKRAYYKHLTMLSAAKAEGIDKMLNPVYGKNNEQQLSQNALNNMYRIFKEELSKHEDNQKQYIIFVNQWVHQMKTPVSVINLLIQEDKKEEKEKILDSIAEENEKISNGLEIMLYNARLSQFNLDFMIESADIVSLARNVINNHKKSFIRYSIFPKINAEAEALVETDKKWAAFVLNQLIINAIKYSKDIDKNDKHLTIEVQKTDLKTLLSIEDEGIGIPREDIKRIFNAFFTGKNGRKTSESTGMGLYLAKKVCDQLGHELIVESEEGKGSKFSIIFYKGKNLYKIS